MGGEGSGRKPDVIKMAREQEQFIKTTGGGNQIEIPNYSGLQAVKKTDPAVGGGAVNSVFGRTGAVIAVESDYDTNYLLISLSGGLAYLPTTLSGSLAYLPTTLSGSLAYLPTSLSGSLGYLYLPVSLSGSLSYIPTSLSGSLAYLPTTLSGSLSYVSQALSGSLGNFYVPVSLSGSWNTHLLSGSGVHGLTSTANVVGTDTTQTLLNKTLSGSIGVDHTVSGSAFMVGVITSDAATPPTASNYAQGTIYIQYTA